MGLFIPNTDHLKSLAYAEIKLILARVLWNFDMHLEPESLSWDKQPTYNLWEKGPLKVRLSLARREPASA